MSDPGNTDLTSLQKELKELIALTEQEIAKSEKRIPTSKSSASSSSKPSASSASFMSGDDVLAKYSGDNSWYPARITSVGGSEDHRVYSVVFKGYNSTEVVQAGSIKPLPPGSSSASVSIGKRKAEHDAEKERKKKKNEKKAEVRAEKAKEQNEKQASWLKFAKKAEKKGAPIAGLSGNSIFKTPDNPHGRGRCHKYPISIRLFANRFIVGVTGSGKGMTETVQRQRHKYTTE